MKSPLSGVNGVTPNLHTHKEVHNDDNKHEEHSIESADMIRTRPMSPTMTCIAIP